LTFADKFASRQATGISESTRTTSGPVVDNPFAGTDPELLELCRQQRDQALNVLLLMHAARDLHEPELLGDMPRFELEEVRACVQLFNALSKPKWTEADLAVLEAYWRWAWKCELSGDLECVRHQLQHAVDAADEVMARLTNRKSDRAMQ
jgi:hypothetical protein